MEFRTDVKRAEDEGLPSWYTDNFKGPRFRAVHSRLRLRRTVPPGAGRDTSNTAAGLPKDDSDEGEEMDSDSDSESEDEDEEEDEGDDMDENEEGEKEKSHGGHDNKQTMTTLPVMPSPTATALPDAQEAATLAPPTGNTHKDIHDLLIGIGTVVGVLLLVGLCFIGWKLRKRSLRPKDPLSQDLDFRKPNPAQKMLNKMPFFEKHFGPKEWYHIEEHTRVSVDKKVSNQPAAWLSRRFDSPSFAHTHDKAMGRPSADLKVDISIAQRELGSDEVSPTSTMLGGETAVYSSKDNSNRSSDINSNSNSNNHPASSPPPYVYPAQRQTVVSDMSSLSSGFGDGDIIMPPPQAAAAPAHRSLTSTSSTGSQGDGNRDTVYTEGSDDSPPRFRTVNSWVRQQSGRVRRAQDDNTPPVPVLPPLELDLGMMMPDGQTPRRVEMDK